MSVTVVLKIDEDHVRGLIFRKRPWSTAILSEFSVQTDELETALLKAVEEHGAKEAIVLFPFYQTVSTVLELPLKKESDISRAVVYKMEDLLPLPSSEYIFSYQILETFNGKSRVLVSALSRTRAEQYTASVKRANLKVVSMRPYFIETLNLFLKKWPSFDPLCVVLKDSEYIEMACIKNGQLQSVHKSKTAEVILRHIQDVSPNVVYTITPCDLPLDDIKELSLDETVVMLNVLHRGRITLEFADSTSARSSLMVHAAVVILTLALATHTLSVLLPYWVEKERLRDINKQIKALKTQATEAIHRAGRLKELTRLLNQLNRIENDSVLPIVVLTEVSRRLPEDAWLMYLKYDKDTVELRGLARDAMRTIKAFNKSDIFKDIKMVAPLMQKPEGEQFRIKLEIKK